MRIITRLTEIDCLRGIVILLMVIFHIVFDLAHFFNWSLDYQNGFWYFQGKFAAVLFMLLSGISTTLSHNPVRRGLILLAAALAITAVTYVYTPTAYIRFGILHLLAAGMLAAPLFRRTGALSLVITGTGIIALGRQFIDMKVAATVLIPLGLQPPGFASLDYYPLCPWLGIILFGMAAGKIFYPKQQSRWPSAAGYRLVRWLSWLGRRSLLVYLMHQPIILTILYACSIAEKTLRATAP